MIAVQKYRMALNLTQKDLASWLSVSKSTVGMWEIGKRKPDVVMLKKIAYFLQCTTDELLEPVKIST